MMRFVQGGQRSIGRAERGILRAMGTLLRRTRDTVMLGLSLAVLFGGCAERPGKRKPEKKEDQAKKDDKDKKNEDAKPKSDEKK